MKESQTVDQKATQLVCAQCGSQLSSSDDREMFCVRCLLRTALGDEDVHHAVRPHRFDQYELITGDEGEPVELGRGAMGVTYKAFDTNLRCEVALKVIHPRYLADESSRARFLSEARAAAQLRHRNIASVFHLGSERGEYFYAMELVEGETVEERVHRKGPIDCATALDISLQITRALIATGNRQFVHRDVKPSNIMLCTEADGAIVAKLIDFGLVRPSIAQSASANPGAARAGFIGTPHFASPEQFAGKATDARSDIYSLGVTLWYMLTGNLPFHGTREEIRRKQLSGALPLDQLKGIPRTAVDLIKRMLEVDSAKRPQSSGALKEQLNKCIAAVDAAKQKQRRRFAYSALVAAAIIITALGAFYFLQRKLVPSAANEIAPEKRIAVLPFENLSDEKANTFFADGVQDDILTKLAKVADLKVISRTSVMQYRGKQDVRLIADALRVSHVLEGTIRRSGGKVHVNAELVDTRTDTDVWAEEYDHDLNDVFAIESEVAQSVANRLAAKVSAREKAAMQEWPTKDVVAFDLFTRADNVLLTVDFTSNAKANLLEGASLLNKAVARDPSFFNAYCLLAWVHDYLYFLGFDRTPARLALADAAIQAAFRLRPDAGEAHLARAWNLYLGYLDYERALGELEVAHESLPNNPRIFRLTGYIQRRQGRWEESTRNLERAVDLDPRNTFALQEIAWQHLLLRRYDEVESLLARVLTIEPDRIDTKVMLASIDFHWKADTQSFHQIINSIQTTNPAAVPAIAEAWLICSLAERDATAAKDALIASGESTPLNNEAFHFNRPFVEGIIARMTGEDDKARAAFTAARTEQEKIVRTQPNYGPPLCVLGLIDAALGRKEEALREGQRAIELLPVEKDAVNGSLMIEYWAVIAAWVGQNDLACDQLAAAVHSPSGLSYGQLKLLPFWDALRGDPRFEKLIEEAKKPVALDLMGNSSPEKSIAVLPFANLSREPDNAYFADGIRAQIVARLAKVANLKIVSGSSTQRYQSAPENLAQVAAELGVANVLEGKVEEAGEKFRIAVRLINARNNADLWAQSYDRTFSEIIQVESEVARQAAGALGLKLTEPEKRAIDQTATSNPRAYEAYLKGRYVWLQRNYDSFQQAKEYFEQAIALDPNYAKAFAGLADAYQFLAAFDARGRKENYEKAKNAYQRALRLEPVLAEAHASAGLVAMNYDWDWGLAEQEFRRAIALDPNEALFYDWYAEYLIAVGRIDESLANIERARELDPFLLIINSDLGKLLYLARLYDEAEAQLKETLRMDPDFTQAHLWLGLTYVMKHRFDDAIAEFSALEKMPTETREAWGWSAYAYAMAGRRTEAEQILEEIKERLARGAYAAIMQAYIGLGDKDQAMAYLERDYESHDTTLTSLKCNPMYDPLRSDPRFVDLMRRVHLAP